MKTSIDPVPSQRTVISESEILHEFCPTCRASVLMPCHNPRRPREPLAYQLDSNELAFHPNRIMAALHTQVSTKMKGVFSSLDRSLITYYAFIMMSDACAANSEKLFEKKYTSEELQAFFAQQAVTVLKKDRLIEGAITQ